MADVLDLSPHLAAKKFADLWEEGSHQKAKALFSDLKTDHKETARAAIVRILDRRKDK